VIRHSLAMLPRLRIPSAMFWLDAHALAFSTFSVTEVGRFMHLRECIGRANGPLPSWATR
jgi:hypothetical protein